jgi:glutathione S-transferase
VANLAVDGLAGRDFLVGERISLADVALASMSAPLQFAPRAIREDPAVVRLLGWDRTILEEEFTPPQVSRNLPG